MSKPKGAAKTGGRAKGTPNKVTNDLRSWINELLNSNKEQFERDLKALEPHQRVALMEKLLSYAIPKMQSVEAKFDIEKLSDSQIDTIINELSNKIDYE